MRFTIKQSCHYSNKALLKFLLIFLNFFRRSGYLNYSVVFSKHWWYDPKVVSYSGWNKIFGFGAIFHHTTSARLVCQPDTEFGKLTVASYVYENGDWNAIEFSHAYIESAVSMSIDVVDNGTNKGYSFTCGKDIIFIEHSNPKSCKLLWPYFGGIDRAYKRLWIKLKRIRS